MFSHKVVLKTLKECSEKAVEIQIPSALFPDLIAAIRLMYPGWKLEEWYSYERIEA